MYAESGCAAFSLPLLGRCAGHRGCRAFASGKFPCAVLPAFSASFSRFGPLCLHVLLYVESGHDGFCLLSVGRSAGHRGCRVFASGKFLCVRAHLESLIVISRKVSFDIMDDLLTTSHMVMPCAYLRSEDYHATTCLWELHVTRYN